MGCIVGVFGVILPRFTLAVGWYNDPDYWNALFSSQLWLALGWLFFPWTTLIYGFAIHSNNGMSLINWIFVALAFLLDLGTYGVGLFGTRKQVSYYRGT
jgi:hypothetical protein